ncbi:MAG: phage tail sheath subtilisin-like domain-containing protein, partial [Gammaproteobacteria bacterium]|nr:phage tail sheath subtilisin-like domain-containing protein [Gammaproteobacteria bacterium]
FKLGDNALHEELVDPANPLGSTFDILRGVGQYDVVLAGTENSSPAASNWYWVEEYFDETLNRYSHQLRRTDITASPDDVVVDLGSVDLVRKLTVSVIVGPTGKFGSEQGWEDLSLHPDHPNSLSRVFAEVPTDRSTELYVPLVFWTDLLNGSDIAEVLMTNANLAGTGNIINHFLLDDEQPSEATRTFRITLENGSDGNLPEAVDYEGQSGATDGIKSGLRSFEDLEDISIIAAPGSSFDYSDISGNSLHYLADAISRLLISHCERMRYRVAVLDSVNGQTQGEIREYRSAIDTTRAALYYPWVRSLDPFTGQYINVPPCGSVTGIFARNDVERGVHKAPANEVVRLAGGLEVVLNKAQQEVLNPLGINCLRFFEGRGFRIWGARTATSDPEWKYLNVRRYFAYLERSIEIGTQWAVFENNGETLWENVRSTIEDFLFNEWRQDHLAGTSPSQAYFVRCDRSTMTQNDLDNGRMICLIGVAPLRPAEFVIFRIGQKTADS